MKILNKTTIVALACILHLSSATNAQKLVLPGDHPDPSVVKIGDHYWATATTSNWAPAYPLLKSSDLQQWETVGHVFPELPAWADYYFWAPEISYDNGRVFVYYAAHKKDGNLCLAVASADRPEGPYKDHGPLMCEKAGSIDAFAVRDTKGQLYMIWKEDGNSIKQPTPIWAMAMNESRTELTGEKKELFRNDVPWEANLVEGVSMIRHGEYIYAFYAGAGCCGRGCTYAMGVARAKDVLGPWEKYDKNPLFTGEAEWKCPGHGTPIVKDGKYYLLYHAYHTKGDVYAGRQGVLKEFRFTADGWIELVDDTGADTKAPEKISDDFSNAKLSPDWQWSVFQKPQAITNNGKLHLGALQERSGSFIGQKTFTPSWKADVVLEAGESTAEGGIAVVGDEKNLVAATLRENKITVWQLKEGVETIIEEVQAAGRTRITLRVQVANGKDVAFYYSTNGKAFKKLNSKPVDAFYLPPWDRAVRVALVSKGTPGTNAIFDDFILENK